MSNTEIIRQYLQKEFDLVGICPAVAPPGLAEFYSWLDTGYSGEMDYLPARREAYADPSHVLDGVRSIVMLASRYASASSGEDSHAAETKGRIARYAASDRDYHDVIHKRLKAARKYFQEEFPDRKFRGVVDTAPLLERDFARLAGLGWQGKNTMLISRTHGSWFFLSAILTDMTLEYDQPFESDHCGTCTACLDACPTDAFVEPHLLDATRCISYWTIESQKLPPLELREKFDSWVFGCDVCQEVCPWNRKSNAWIPEQETEDHWLAGQKTDWSLTEMHQILNFSEKEFRDRFRKTPFWRSKRRGIIRNILIVLGNIRSDASLPFLKQALKDPDPLVRAAAVSALRNFNGEQNRLVLEKAAENETDSVVLSENKAAIDKN